MNISALQQRWQKIRAHRQLLVAAGTVISVLGGGVAVIAGADNGYWARKHHLLSGAAWLPSDDGSVTLIDGNTATVAGQVKVTAGKADLDIVQQDRNTYAVDHNTNTLYRIDGALPAASALKTQPFANSEANVALFAGPEQIYAVDSRNHLVVQLIPEAPKSPHERQLLSAAADLNNIMVDNEGTLWAYASERGELSSVAEGEPPKTPITNGARGARLVLVNGKAVLVEPANKSATILTTKDGHPDPIKLNLPASASIRSIGVSPHTNRIYVTTATAVTICDLTDNRCQPAIPVANANLDTPVEAKDRLFVPDNKTGKVTIINPATNSLEKTVPVLNKPEDFHLLAHEGHVFFNNPKTKQAGVIRPNGEVIPIGKDTLTYQRSVTPSTPTKRPPSTSPTAPPSTSPVPPPPPTTTPPTSPPPTEDPSSDPPTNPKISFEPPNPPAKANKSADLIVKLSKEQPKPTAVTWDFGDENIGHGFSVSHTWTKDETYHVTATATFPNDETATFTLEVTVGPRSTLTIKPPSHGVITGDGINCGPAGSAKQVCKVPNNDGSKVTMTAQPDPGYFFESWTGDCTPPTETTCTTQVKEDHTVAATFRLGIRLMPHAENAKWSTEASTLSGQGKDRDEQNPEYEKGHAYAVTYKENTATLQNGKKLAFLETHPMDGDWIQGAFAVDNIEGKRGFRFRADYGFNRKGSKLGDATFSVIAIMKPGSSTTETKLGSDDHSAGNTELQKFDILIEPEIADNIAEIGLRVEAKEFSADNWCVWLDPRIEG